MNDVWAPASEPCELFVDEIGEEEAFVLKGVKLKASEVAGEEVGRGGLCALPEFGEEDLKGGSDDSLVVLKEDVGDVLW